MKQLYIDFISNTVGVVAWRVENTLKLLSEGATVPFISRYRKEMTGGLDETMVAQIKVLSEKVMGKNHNVGKYLVQNQQGQRYEMLYFGDLDAFRACYSASNLIKLVFYPSINEYMGRESVQFIMQEYDACEETKP